MLEADVNMDVATGGSAWQRNHHVKFIPNKSIVVSVNQSDYNNLS